MTESNGSRTQVLARIAEKLGGSARAETVFGTAVERDGVTIVPVARARWGFGGGGSDEQLGAGGGLVLTPAGWIEMTPEGSRYRPIRGDAWKVGLVAAGLLGLFALARRIR